jgi:hypothetical protein
MLRKLGKRAVADYLRTKLPTKKTIRSGDLGEIIATEYIDECTEFTAPIKRLRWKDHRDMSMRGDDVIGIYFSTKEERVRFLKSEAKSISSLNARTIQNAREALDGNNGLPSSHSLSFVADRLSEMGQTEIADMINRAQLLDGVRQEQVEHMVFTLSGNDPVKFLRTHLNAYKGPIRQRFVGLRMRAHQDFIESVFAGVQEKYES